MANPYLRSLICSHVLALCLLLFAGTVEAQDTPFVESVVIFNTVCARCHEAECSGRLSFEQAYEAVMQHIVRHYAGAADKVWLQRQLVQLLGHMKEKCAYYPVRVPIPPQRIWSPELLDKFTTLLQRNYFVPLGPLSTGDYRIEVDLDAGVLANIQLVSESFEMIVDDCFTANEGSIVIPLHIGEPSNYYFRIYPNRPTRLRRLAVLVEHD